MSRVACDAHPRGRGPIRFHSELSLAAVACLASLALAQPPASAPAAAPQEGRAASCPRDRIRARVAEELANLQSTDAQKRSVAANQLGHLRAREAIPALRKILVSDAEDGRLRCTAASALGELGASEAMEDLRALLRGRPSRLALAAAGGLLQLGEQDERTLSRIVALLDLDDHTAREGLCLMLGANGVESAVPKLASLLAADDLHTCYWAAAALGMIGKRPEACVAELQKLLARIRAEPGLDDRRRAEFREAGERALILVDPDGQKELLEARLAQGDATAARQLARRGDTRAFRVLLGAGELGTLNWFSEPALAARLDAMRVVGTELRSRNIAGVLEHVRVTFGVALEVSAGVKEDLDELWFGANLGMLGGNPSAGTVLNALVGWFVAGGGPELRLTWIADAGRIRIVPHAEAEAFWTEFAKSRLRR